MVQGRVSNKLPKWLVFIKKKQFPLYISIYTVYTGCPESLVFFSYFLPNKKDQTFRTPCIYISDYKDIKFRRHYRLQQDQKNYLCRRKQYLFICACKMRVICKCIKEIYYVMYVANHACSFPNKA